MNALEQYVLCKLAAPGDIDVQVPDGKGGWITAYSGTKEIARPGQYSGYIPPNNSSTMKPANADTKYGYTRNKAATRAWMNNNPKTVRNIKFGLGAAVAGAGMYAANKMLSSTPNEKTAGENLLSYTLYR